MTAGVQELRNVAALLLGLALIGFVLGLGLWGVQMFTVVDLVIAGAAAVALLVWAVLLRGLASILVALARRP